MFLGALIGALRCCGLGPSDTLAQLLQLAIFRLKRFDQVGALVWRFPIIPATIGRVSDYKRNPVLTQGLSEKPGSTSVIGFRSSATNVAN